MNELLLRRRAMMGDSDPSAYRIPVEYLESHGQEHIITDLYGDENVGYEVVFEYSVKRSPEDANSASIFGSRVSFNSNGLQVSTYNNGSAQVANALYQNLGFQALDTVHTLKLSGDTVYFNDVAQKTANTTTFTTPAPIVLFALYNNGSYTEHLTGRIYQARFFDRYTGENIAVFKPVRLGTTGYMLEEISGRLYPNNADGDFSVGPDVSQS